MEKVLRKEYLDEFEQLKANLYVANRLLPKSDTFHRGIAFGAYNVPPRDIESGQSFWQSSRMPYSLRTRCAFNATSV